MGIIRYGVHQQLEEAADEILFPALAKITSQADKKDVLTPWKEKDRRRREVYVPSGTPDLSARVGYFHRAYNFRSAHLNSQPGGAHKLRTDSLSEWVTNDRGATL